MDAVEAETRGLSYDETKANTWHPLVWICHERRSRHPLTDAVHKLSYKSEETLFLWPRQAYGSGCSCTPSLTTLSHDKTGLRTVWHLEVVSTTRSSAKMLDGAGHHEHMALFLMLGVLRWIGQHGGCYDPSTVKGERERERERSSWYGHGHGRVLTW